MALYVYIYVCIDRKINPSTYPDGHEKVHINFYFKNRNTGIQQIVL